MNWVACAERLPEQLADVLLCYIDQDAGGPIVDAGYRSRIDGWHLVGDQLVDGRVTHWMPLPAPPLEAAA